MKVGKVAKAVVAAVGTLSVVAGGIVADDVVNASEGTTLLTQIVLAALTIYGVYKKGNAKDPETPATEEDAAA